MSLRALIKSMALTVFDAAGVNRGLRRLNRGRVAILCYHGVVSRDCSHTRFQYENTVSVAEFESHLRFIRHHFKLVSGADVLAALHGSRPLPPRALLVTFDDGYKNNLTLAAPLLRKYDVPAIFHVSTGHIDTNYLLWPREVVTLISGWPLPVIETPHDRSRTVPVPAQGDQRRELAQRLKEECKKLSAGMKDDYLEYLRRSSTAGEPTDRELTDFMDWDEVQRLHAMGFEIGSHTVHHPILSRCDPERLKSELHNSKQRIEAYLRTECRWLAYPNGGSQDYDERVKAAAREAGYQAAFVLNDRFSSPGEDPMELSRVWVPGHVPARDFRFLASGGSGFLARFRGARSGY